MVSKKLITTSHRFCRWHSQWFSAVKIEERNLAMFAEYSMKSNTVVAKIPRKLIMDCDPSHQATIQILKVRMIVVL